MFFFTRIAASNIGRTLGAVCPTAEVPDRALVASEKTPARSTIPLCSTTRSSLLLRTGPGGQVVAERCNLLQIAARLTNCRNLSQTVAKRRDRAPLNALQCFA